MIMTENTNLKAILQITDADGDIKPVIAINSNIVKGGNNLSLNFTLIDDAIMVANVEAVQVEMDSFKAALNAKMVEFGYQITI